jgi:integrase/recombinase XerD
VKRYTRHFDKSPETIAPEDIRSYQLYLSTEKKSAPATVAIAVSALRFFYGVTLQRSWVMEETIPMPKRLEALPAVLSPDEVVEFLECVPQAKHRAILMSCYAARLRVSEVVRLKPGDIDTRRMVIRIEQGKGRRDRYVMLSSRLVDVLEKWRVLGNPKQWLFPGNPPENPITRYSYNSIALRPRQYINDGQLSPLGDDASVFRNEPSGSIAACDRTPNAG